MLQLAVQNAIYMIGVEIRADPMEHRIWLAKPLGGAGVGEIGNPQFAGNGLEISEAGWQNCLTLRAILNLWFNGRTQQ